nr:hypothetical protein [Pseudomonadota bacterium]
LNSHDEDFDAKAQRICQLYVGALSAYEQGRLVVCCDEKTGKDSSNPLATVSNGAACHPWVGRNPRAQCSGQVGAGRRPYRASQHGAHLSCGIWSK